MGLNNMELSKRFSGAACLAAMISTASAVDVPNQFSSGQVAKASEVNENFEALESGINANDSAIGQIQADVAGHDTRISALELPAPGGGSGFGSPWLYDASGAPIGAYLGSGNFNTHCSSFSGVHTLLSSTGYLLAFNQDFDGFGACGEQFTQPGCQGQAYVIDMETNFANGIVYSRHSDESTYYVAADEPAVEISRLSVRTSNACVDSVTPTTVTTRRAFPNDPGVTGLSEPINLPVQWRLR